jgi:probable HAF family extracellular repeat protein
MKTVTALRFLTGPLPDRLWRVLLPELAAPGRAAQGHRACSRGASRLRWGLAALVAAGIAGPAPALSQNYDVTPLPFADYPSILALNDNGVVVGEIANPDGSVSLGEWSHGTLTNLGMPAGLPSEFDFVQPSAINDSGTIVGTVRTQAGGGTAYSFMYSQGSFTVLPLATPTSTGGIATAINNSGQIVGYDSNSSNGNQAWLWSKGAYTILPVAGDSTALGINSHGTIIGNIIGNGERGYVLAGGTVQYLSEGVNAINDAGVAVGSNGFATVARNGTETPILSVPSSAYGINAAGEVVGFYSPYGIGTHLFIWDSSSGAHDLTPDGYENAAPLAINDQGDIIGYGQTASGTYQDFLLTPDPNGELTLKDLITSPVPTGVPEPDTLLLFGLGLAVTFVAYRAR